MLACGHYACKSHVESLSKGGKLPCPSCNALTVLQPDGLRIEHSFELVIDVWRERAREKLEGGTAGKPKPAPKCGFCEERLATRQCSQCEGVLCTVCEKTLHTKGMFKNHLVGDLTEEESLVDDEGGVRRMLCFDHPEEKLNFFCMDCRKLVCSHCLLLGDHKGHNQNHIGKACETGRTNLNQWVDAIRSRLGKVETVTEKLEKVEVDVLAGAEEQRQSISTELDHLRELVETKRRQLLSKGAFEEKQKRMQLQAQMQRTESISKRAIELVERSTELLTVTNDHAFLATLLPLIQDMRKCANLAIDNCPQVSAAFKPLSTDAQARLLEQLDLGHPAVRVSVLPGAPTTVTQRQSMNYPSTTAGSYTAAPATVSFVPQAQPMVSAPMQSTISTQINAGAPVRSVSVAVQRGGLLGLG